MKKKFSNKSIKKQKELKKFSWCPSEIVNQQFTLGRQAQQLERGDRRRLKALIRRIREGFRTELGHDLPD